VFGVDETYNQHRLSILNHAAPKIVCTHCGLDVGEDGKTHQCVDYAGVFRNLLGVEVIVPADPNQTDRAVRYAAQSRKMILMAMGRSKAPVICREDGTPVFGGEYQFRYGAADVVREGGDAAIVVSGALCSNAIAAHEMLRGQGIAARVIHVATPLEECERRDVKGLYQRARSGAVAHFTGVSDPYEAPEQPELVIDTTRVPLAAARDMVLNLFDGTPPSPL